METILQLCETENENYPDHFRVFLNKCLAEFPDTFIANDYLFAAVFFIILECGFYPLSEVDNCPYSHFDSFDVRKLRLIKCHNGDHMKLVQTHAGGHWVYGIPLTLGSYSCECELQGVPSTENSTYLIVNFLAKQLGVVKSLCLNTENYTEKNSSSSKHSVRLKNLQELSLLIRDKVSTAVKDNIMISEGQGCCPHLLRLPEDIQKKIIYNLTGNSVDVQYLASTCSYFYNVITTDTELWRMLCMAEFREKAVNEAMTNAVKADENHDCNLFRKVFLDLKVQRMRRGYRYSIYRQYSFY